MCIRDAYLVLLMGWVPYTFTNQLFIPATVLPTQYCSVIYNITLIHLTVHPLPLQYYHMIHQENTVPKGCAE